MRLVVPAGGSTVTWLRLVADTPLDRPVRRRRRRGRRSARRGRRVLRRHHARPRGRRRRVGHAPGAGRDAVVEAVLLLRPRRVAARAPVAPAAQPRQPDAQRGVVPHGQPRRHLDARQVGVPVVRGVGPRLPQPPAGDGRPRLRQVAARPDAVASCTSTRPGRSRPTSGTSATSTRRCTPSPRCSCTASPAASATSIVPFLRQSFLRLLLNFTWWVNRKDPAGKNVFEGGFLGLDNIGVFDRSAPVPAGGRLEQADGTGWMALFSQNMLELALALAEHDPDYADFVFKFVEHFFWIAAAIDPIGEHPDEMWDEEDGFFYDVLRHAGRHRAAAQGALAGRAAADVRDDRDLGPRVRGPPRADGAHRRLPGPQPRPASPTSPTRSSPASTAAACCRS